MDLLIRSKIEKTRHMQKIVSTYQELVAKEELMKLNMADNELDTSDSDYSINENIEEIPLNQDSENIEPTFSSDNRNMIDVNNQSLPLENKSNDTDSEFDSSNLTDDSIYLDVSSNISGRQSQVSNVSGRQSQVSNNDSDDSRRASAFSKNASYIFNDKSKNPSSVFDDILDANTNEIGIQKSLEPSDVTLMYDNRPSTLDKTSKRISINTMGTTDSAETSSNDLSSSSSTLRFKKIRPPRVIVKTFSPAASRFTTFFPSSDPQSPSSGNNSLSNLNIFLKPSSNTSTIPSLPLTPSLTSIAPNLPLPSKTVPSIKDFEIIKPISKGAFGSVYLAKKRVTGDYYAIKVLKKSDMIAKNQVMNIKAERMILTQLDSPYIVKLFYSFQSRDNLYLVMEYLNGGDCAALIKAVGQLDESWAKQYISEVVLGLEFLHSKGIIHRFVSSQVNLYLNIFSLGISNQIICS